MHTNALELIDELIEKWLDVTQSADDWVEKNTGTEVLDDLRDIKKELLNG